MILVSLMVDLIPIIHAKSRSRVKSAPKNKDIWSFPRKCVTSTSHHHPFIALFFSSNGRKIDDPRTKREIEIKSFILAQKDRRSRRETRTLRRKRMRFVAPFPRVCSGRELFKGEMIKFYRENYLSLTCALPCAARARTKRHQEKKEQPESKRRVIH